MMIRLTTILISLALFASVALAAESAAPRIYISNERSGDISVIDSASNKVIATIPVGKRPRGIQLTPDGRTLYVALSGSPITPPGQERNAKPADKTADGIGVVDTTSLKLIDKLPSGSDPEQFSLSLDGRRLYISNEDVNQATVLDIASRQPAKVFEVGEEPEGVTTSPDGKRVYVTSESTNEIHVIDTALDTITHVLRTAEPPRSVAFLPDGSKAYVTCETAGVVCVIDVAKNEVIKHIKSPGQNPRPMGSVASPDGTRVYVTTGRGGSVIVIDTAKDQVARTVDNVGTRPWGIDISPDGRFLYTANGPSDDVSVIDTATAKVVGRIKAGTSPWGVIVSK